MRAQVCDRLQGTLNTWQYNLQAKWGDPEVYAREEEERLRQDARMVYDLNRRNTVLLSDAYEKRAEKQRQDHTTRMDHLKHRGYRNASKRPQSEAASTQSRTEPPPSQPRPSTSEDFERPPE